MLSSLRYNHPAIYYGLCTVCIAAVFSLLTSLLLTHGSSFGKRVSALGNALYWEARAFAYDGPDKKASTPVKHFMAEIKGMTRTGNVVFSMFTNSGMKIVEAELADLKITNLKGTTKVVNKYKGKRVYVDYYQYKEGEMLHHCVVLWDEFDAPVNVEIVERNYAKPIETPPTNVVNTLMAKYFWKAFKDGE